MPTADYWTLHNVAEQSGRPDCGFSPLRLLAAPVIVHHCHVAQWRSNGIQLTRFSVAAQVRAAQSRPYRPKGSLVPACDYPQRSPRSPPESEEPAVLTRWRWIAVRIREAGRGSATSSARRLFFSVHFSPPSYLSRGEISNRAAIHHWLTGYWSPAHLLFSTKLYYGKKKPRE